jgi:hypothetical protein
MQKAEQAVAEVMALKDRYASLVMECVANGKLYVSCLEDLNAESQKLHVIALQHTRSHHKTDDPQIDTQAKVVALRTDAADDFYRTCTVSFDNLATMQTAFKELKQSTQREINAVIDNSTEQSDRIQLSYLLARVSVTRVQSRQLENVVKQMNFLQDVVNAESEKESEKAPSTTHSHRTSEHSDAESWTLWLGSQDSQRNHFADAVHPLAQALVSRAYPPVPAIAFHQRAQVSPSAHTDSRLKLARTNPALHALCARVAHIAFLAQNEQTVAVAAHRFAVEIREHSSLVSRALLDETELRLLRRCAHRSLQSHSGTEDAESQADSTQFNQQSRGGSHAS